MSLVDASPVWWANFCRVNCYVIMLISITLINKRF